MFRYIVIEHRRLSPTSLLLSLRPQDPSRALNFAVGQYAAINFIIGGRPTTVRCFSIVNAPGQANLLQFGLRLSGPFTDAATALQPGDEVQVRGPFGQFLHDTQAEPNVVFFAGGIGITPFVSRLREALVRPPVGRMVLVYSCRSQDDIPFLAELTVLEQRLPRLTVIYVIGSGPITTLGGRKVVQGKLTPALIERLFGQYFSAYHYYLCGPKPFMRTIEKALRRHGVADTNIDCEEFGLVRRRWWPLQFGLQAKTYAATAFTLALGTGLVMMTDVQGYSARLAAAQAAPDPATIASPTPSSPPMPSDTPEPTQTPTPAPFTAPISQATPMPTPDPTMAPTPVTAPIQQYQPPVSSVS